MTSFVTCLRFFAPAQLSRFETFPPPIRQARATKQRSAVTVTIQSGSLSGRLGSLAAWWPSAGPEMPRDSVKVNLLSISLSG